METPPNVDRLARMVQEERRKLHDRLAAQGTETGGRTVSLAQLFSVAFGGTAAEPDAQ